LAVKFLGWIVSTEASMMSYGRQLKFLGCQSFVLTFDRDEGLSSLALRRGIVPPAIWSEGPSLPSSPPSPLPLSSDSLERELLQPMHLHGVWGSILIQSLLLVECWDRGASPPLLRMRVGPISAALPWSGLDTHHVPPSIKSSIAEKKPKEFAFDQDFVCGHTPDPPFFREHKGARRQRSMPSSVYYRYQARGQILMGVRVWRLYPTATGVDESEVNLSLWNVGSARWSRHGSSTFCDT
jgi:hypothetical protein